MAESSTSTSHSSSIIIDNNTTNGGGDSSSPIISTLAQDHLFTVLLLLPVESILSFSMTCKKFRALASSDSLWESICRRDWGSTSVDGLKSSSSYVQLPWIQVYKQVCRLDSVACHNLNLSVEEEKDRMLFPSPRASHSLNFVSDCLVLFGGGCEGGRHLDDTWVAYIGNNELRRRLNWQKVNSGFPSGRFGHSCCVIGGEFLVLFGGIDDYGNRQNDTWIGQVGRDESHHQTTLTWRALDVGPSVVPAPRGAHAACDIDKRKMVVHGGIGLYGVRLGDTWILELSEDMGYGRWHQLEGPRPSPPPRSGHTLTCIGGSKTLLFGGRGLGYEVLKDVWVLDVVVMKWVQLVYELPDTPLLPRVGHSATLVLGGRLLIYGGEDSYRHRKDDFWLLDTNTICRTTSTHYKPLAPTSWKRLSISHEEGGVVYKPKSRSFHRACADSSGRYVYVFGGMVDGTLLPAAASGLRFDGELFLAELMLLH